MAREVRYLGWEVAPADIRPEFLRPRDTMLLLKVEVDGVEYKFPHIFPYEEFGFMQGNLFSLFPMIALAKVADDWEPPQ
jgi:hypothetical protein